MGWHKANGALPRRIEALGGWSPLCHLIMQSGRLVVGFFIPDEGSWHFLGSHPESGDKVLYWQEVDFKVGGERDWREEERELLGAEEKRWRDAGYEKEPTGWRKIDAAAASKS